MQLIDLASVKNVSLLILVGMLVLAGCSAGPVPEGQADAGSSNLTLPTQTPAPLPTPSPIPESSVRGEVVIWVAYNPIELEGLQRIIDRFASSNPDIAFALAYYQLDELLDAYLTQAPMGRGPTILIGPSEWGPDLYDQGEILDLGALIDANLEQAIYPAAWSQARSDPTVFGLPFELKGVLLFRNRALAPEAPATVANWVTTMDDLVAAEGNETLLDMSFTYSGGFLPTCGGALESRLDRAQLWGPVGICWLELLGELGSAATPVFNSELDYQAFINGQSPWLIDLAERRPQLQAALGEESLAVNPWPVYANQAIPLRGYTWTENIYIAAGAPSVNLEAAWAFARYLLTPESQMIMAEPSGAGHIPVIASAELTDPLMVESSAMLRSGVPWPLQFTDQEFLDTLETAVVNVVQQGSNPIFALNFAQESLGLPITNIPTATPQGND